MMPCHKRVVNNKYIFRPAELNTFVILGGHQYLKGYDNLIRELIVNAITAAGYTGSLYPTVIVCVISLVKELAFIVLLLFSALVLTFLIIVTVMYY